jgi:hypothetical protein
MMADRPFRGAIWPHLRGFAGTATLAYEASG